MMDRYEPSIPHVRERPKWLVDLAFGISQTWSKSGILGERSTKPRDITRWLNRLNRSPDEEQRPATVDQEYGHTREELKMAHLSPSNKASDSHSTESSTDPGPSKSIAVKSSGTRTDFICLAIGRADDWRLCHVKFPVNEQGVHHDSRGNAAIDSDVFRKILATFKKELRKRWLQQIIFPVKLSRVEYGEVTHPRTSFEINLLTGN
jgi:hypothetical protein